MILKDMDSMNIGPTPAEERCEQLGPDFDSQQAKKECRAFAAQIRRHLGPEPDGAELILVPQRHEYGTYYEVECRYETDNEAVRAYAFRCEAEAPNEWDAIARKELGL